MTSLLTNEKRWQTLTSFSLPSQLGSDQLTVARVAAAVRAVPLAPAQVDALKTAVAEAALNAIEHGNRFRPELLLEVAVFASETAVVIRISDQGKNPIPDAVEPDIYAKLAGEQSPRGWGLFLIRAMADEWHISRDEDHHTIELRFNIVAR